MPVFCLRSLVPSVQWQILQSAKMNLAVAQAQPTWNLAWQKMPRQPSRHSVGIPCQTEALWEFMSRKILGQVDSASKWAKLQALQHATHVQISICPMFHRTTHLSARRYTEKRELKLMELGAKWSLIRHQNIAFSSNSSESHCKKNIKKLGWSCIDESFTPIQSYTYEHSCSIHSIHESWHWFFGSLYSQVEHWLRRTAAWLCWSSTLMAFASCTLAFRNRRVANVDSTWATARDWVSQDWVISIQKWVEGVILEVLGHWREPGTELKPTNYLCESARRSWCGKHFFLTFVKGNCSKQESSSTRKPPRDPRKVCKGVLPNNTKQHTYTHVCQQKTVLNRDPWIIVLSIVKLRMKLHNTLWKFKDFGKACQATTCT